MFTASWPSDAVSTRCPAFSSTRRHRRCATSLSSATRIATRDWSSGMTKLHRRRDHLGRQRDGEVESRPVPDGALDPDLAPMHLHDLLNDGQAEAGPVD